MEILLKFYEYTLDLLLRRFAGYFNESGRPLALKSEMLSNLK